MDKKFFEQLEGLKYVLLVVGLWGLFTNTYYNKHERYYLGEKLINLKIIVDKVEVWSKTKYKNFFKLKTRDWNCSFVISEGAFAEISAKLQIKKEIEAITEKDTVEIKFRELDKELINNAKVSIRVIEIKKNQQVMLSEEAVERRDRISYRNSIYVAIGALLIFAIVNLVQVLVYRYSSPVKSSPYTKFTEKNE